MRWSCLLLLALPACDDTSAVDDVPLCTPGRQVACRCVGGFDGVQLCAEDGTFGACACGEDGGVDAMVDLGSIGRFTLPAECERLIGPADDSLRLGAVLPLSGALGEFGPAMARGVELATEQINAAGGVAGRPLAVALCDSGSDPLRGAAVVRAGAGAGLPAFVGPAISSVALEALNDAARPTGTLLMSPSATSPLLSTIDDEGLFWRTAASDGLQAEALAAWLRDEGLMAARILVVHREDPFGVALADAFEGEAVGAVSRAGFFGDPAPAIEAIRAAGPDLDVVVFFVFQAEFRDLLDAVVGAPRLLVTDALRVADVGRRMSRDERARLWGVAPVAPGGAAWERFAAAHMTRFGEPPGLFAAHAWDATQVLALALARAPDGRGTDLAAALRDGVADSHATAAGTRLFDATGDAVGPVQLWQFGDDGAVELGPVVLD